MTAPWYRDEGSGAALRLTLTLHVQPGARTSGVAGVHGEALKVRLAAPPVEGKANAALLRFMAEAFGVPVRQVGIARGAASRHKIVHVHQPTCWPAWCPAPRHAHAAG